MSYRNQYQQEMLEAQQAVAEAELEATRKYVLAMVPEITESLMREVVYTVTERLAANRKFTSHVVRDDRKMCMELVVQLEYDLTGG